MNNLNCCVCLEEKATIPLDTFDLNHETIVSKLRKLVSEVEWKDKFTICTDCLGTLDVVIQFLKTCIRSNSIRLEQEKSELKCVSEECPNDPKHIEAQVPSFSTEGTIALNSEIPESSFNLNEKLCIRDTEAYNSQHENNSSVLSVEKDEDNSNCKSDIDFSCDESNNDFSSKSQYEVKMENVFICFHCNKSYKRKMMLAKHIKVKHDVLKNVSKELGSLRSDVLPNNHIESSESSKGERYKKFTCVKCEKSYKAEKVMIDHTVTCDGIKRHSKISFPKDFSKNECIECGRLYTTEKNLKAHMKQCRKNGNLPQQQDGNCYICGIYLKDAKYKFEHVLKEHGIDLKVDFSCHFCYKQFLNDETLQSHIQEDHETEKIKKVCSGRSYSCEVCSGIFGYVKEVIQHCVEEHKMNSKSVKPYQCNKCPTRFTSSANLIQHKQYHEGERSHICSFCGKSFITKSDLKVHEYTHLNRRNYKCEICLKAFNTNKNLRSHKLVVHTDSSLWKFQCKLCDKKFPLKCGYDQHIKRHEGDKQFKCLICEKSFVSASELTRHRTLHSNERAFKCSHCNKEFKLRRVYEIHLTKVHGIGNAKIPVRLKKFLCTICPLKFLDKQKLSRHMCTHTGIKPFGCNICDKQFSDKSYLKHHFKVKHNLIVVQNNEMSGTNSYFYDD